MDPPPNNGTTAAAVDCLEIRLFYVRVSPCAAVPPQLALSHLRPGHDALVLPLRLDRLDPAAGEATYVSTAAVRLPAADFEVADDRGAVLLRGSLRRLADAGWAMDCAASKSASALAAAAFFEVYVAGCFAGEPVILTRALQLGAPDDGSGNGTIGLFRRRPALATAAGEEDDNDTKLGSSYYPEGWYDDDGQLSWFNAGVRVGVGIGLGMCVGVGIGVGLLMRSYQATTRSFKRRFF